MREEYERALEALGTLITALKRSDGSKWQEHFNSMHTFLQRLSLEKALPDLKIIHVAGTKGKGSTCCMIEAMLRHSGYKTGLFTSPHLCDVRERIRLNGRPVSKDTFLKCFWECFETFRKTSTEAAGMPAYFRFLTLLAFKTFIEEGVDVAVIEVGLGGRLDATNIVPNPVVCGISSLGYDHMELLGYTLTEIAREKAGIFKRGRPAITVPQDKEAQQSLDVEAERAGVVLSMAPEFSLYRDSHGQSPSIGLAGRPLLGVGEIASEVRLNALGLHQKINAALAIALAGEFEAGSCSPEALQRAALVHNCKLPDSYRDGLVHASWPGRCQLIEERITVGSQTSHLDFYIDGAHTPESLAACGHWFADCIQSPAPVKANGSVHTSSSQHKTTTPFIQNGSSRAHATRNFLVFNCMKEREPERLLKSLQETLLLRGASFESAIFVPPDSVYSKAAVSKAASLDEAVDLSWQVHLRSLWQTQTKAKQQPLTPVSRLPDLPGVVTLGEQNPAHGAVLPSIRSTLTWLRSCARSTANVEIRVLVTGSLYLVGDFLRHLKQEL